MKQNPQTNQTNPKQNPHTNQRKTKQTHKKKRNPQKTPKPLWFRFSRKREIERIERKKRVERDKPCCEKERKKHWLLRVRTEEESAWQFLKTEGKRRWKISKYLGMRGDFKSMDLGPWNPRWIWAKSKSNTFKLSKQRIWIWAPSNPNPNPNSCHPNRPLGICWM